MIKRRAVPDTSFEPIVVGKTHLVKERSGWVVTTRCGTIVDQKSRAPIKVTLWNDYDCPQCLQVRPVAAPQARRRVKRRSEAQRDGATV